MTLEVGFAGPFVHVHGPSSRERLDRHTRATDRGGSSRTIQPDTGTAVLRRLENEPDPDSAAASAPTARPPRRETPQLHRGRNAAGLEAAALG
jgi:hypothetical protein